MNRDWGSRYTFRNALAKASALTLAAALWMGIAVTSAAAERPAKPLKIAGLATKVEPTQVTVRDNKGNEVTVQTKEDFTEKVAVGSAVTALYFRGSGTNELQWLEYALENSFISPKQFCPRIKRIILLPHSDAGDADGIFDAVEGFLQTKLGLVTAHRMLAEEIRDRGDKSDSTLKYVDPATGDVDLAAYAQAHRTLVQRIAAVTRVDAVLEANVEVVQANFHQQLAAWDGAQQPVSSATSRTLAFIAAVPVNGHVPASTVVLKLWDAQGKLLWSNRRGFCVLALQKGVGTSFRDYSISQALEANASVEKWMASVFASWLPGAASLEAGLPKP